MILSIRRRNSVSPVTQRVVVGGTRDKVVGEVGAAVGHRRDVINGQIEFLKA